MQKFENAGNRVMNKELEDVEMQIKESEEMYLNKFSGISEQQMKLLMDMIWWLENWFSGCSTNNWGMIGYIPLLS